jgi:hypothetical protein
MEFYGNLKIFSANEKKLEINLLGAELPYS